RVIPHVATGPIARTESSATPCSNSSKDSVDNNKPANSDKAAPTPTDTGCDIARRPHPATRSTGAPHRHSPRNGIRQSPYHENALSTTRLTHPALPSKRDRLGTQRAMKPTRPRCIHRKETFLPSIDSDIA